MGLHAWVLAVNPERLALIALNESMGDFSTTIPDAARPNASGSLAVETGKLAYNAESAPKVLARAKILENPTAVAILFGLIALFLFLIGIRKPEQGYYDEGFYILPARALLANVPGPNNGSPPLGKLLIAEGIQLLGDNSLGWRVPGAIFGALTLTGIFLWTFLLTLELRVAALAASLTLFNNFLFVMSRVAMLDVFLGCFIVWGLVAYTAALELDVSAAKRRILFYCSGISLGLATAVKLNGVDTLAVLILLSVALLWLGQKPFMSLNPALSCYAQRLQQPGIFHLSAAFVLAPLISYSLPFWPLCRSLHVPFNFRQLVDISLYLWRFKVTTQVNMAIASKWYTWPFHLSPLRALSYLLGNPVVMWGGIASLVFSLRRIWKSLALPETLLLVLYLVHWLQWAITPVKATFYYYYFPSAMFLGVALALALRHFPRTFFGVRLGFVVLIAAAVVFLWCVPRMAHLGPPWDCALGCWI